MYRLLIVTKDPRVEDMFASMGGWEPMGFKQPRLRKTVAEAVECMKKHHIDAIAIDDDSEYAELESILNDNAPNMPIFQIADDAQKQLDNIREVEILLNRLRADDSNDDYDEGYYFRLAREQWMRRLVLGFAPTKEYVLEHLRMYRCVDDPKATCVYARLSMPQGDAFITERWHYGSERLGTALSNFFGTEHDRMNLHLAVVSPEEVRIVICPQKFCDRQISLDRATRYLNEAVEQIGSYLGLKMTVEEIQLMNGLTDFAADRNQD